MENKFLGRYLPYSTRNPLPIVFHLLDHGFIFVTECNKNYINLTGFLSASREDVSSLECLRDSLVFSMSDHGQNGPIESLT
jgi:hypothetical protein